MTYPSINGATINGSEAVETRGLQPVVYGEPSLLLAFHASSLQPAQFGMASTIMQAASLRPVRFGVAALTMQAASLRPARFGTPALVFRVASLQPAQFGLARVKFGTDIMAVPASLSPVHFGAHSILGGLPPASWVRPADSLKPVRFGTPGLKSSLHIGPVASLQPVKLGLHKVRCALPAASLAADSFGMPGLAVNMRAASVRPVRFGTGRAVHRFYAASLHCTQFGAPGIRLRPMALSATSLHPVQFGAVSMYGVSLRARGMCPVRFGRPVLNKGGIC